MRKLIVAGVVVGVVVWLALALVSLPPLATEVDTTSWRSHLPGVVVRGAYHVHTERSDGTGTLDSVARAAARAGLEFVIVTDHGDATRTPESPGFRSGVLVVDAVEISTTGGHYVALDTPAAPYPLAGEPHAVVEDVARLGGFGVIAHPDSPKGALGWNAWFEPVDGFEWLNADTEWRNESRGRLLQTLLHYPFRSAESLAALFERPAVTLERWDRLSADGRRLVALGAADAHARLGLRGDVDPYEGTLALELPSYETVFRVFSTSVELDRPLSGRAPEDARRLLDAIRAGRVFTTVDALARGGRFEFWADRGGHVHRMGEVVPGGSVLRLTARVAAPAGAEIRLLANGAVLATSSGLDLVHDVRPEDSPESVLTAYRIEVTGVGRAHPQMPWMVGNPIFVGTEAGKPAPGSGHPDGAVEATASSRLSDAGEVGQWRVEKDAASTGMLFIAEGAAPGDFALEFEISRGRPEAWVAAAHPLPVRTTAATWGRLAFKARADKPMRLSVQLRAPSTDRDQRWQRSIYLDVTERDVSLAVDDLRPVRSADPGVDRAEAETLLFVVDRTNSSGGASGRVWISDLRFDAATSVGPSGGSGAVDP